MRLFILSFLFLFGCSHHQNMPKESNVEIVKDFKGNRWANIYFSAQPSQAEMEKLKEAGFSAVINLRQKNENNYQESWERKIVRSQGLNYYNIPMSMKTDLNDEFIDSITSKVVKHRKDGKVLIHCSSGNRVAIWLGAHFKKDHGFSNEKSLELAKELGLTKEDAEGKLRSYLK